MIMLNETSYFYAYSHPRILTAAVFTPSVMKVEFIVLSIPQKK